METNQEKPSPFHRARPRSPRLRSSATEVLYAGDRRRFDDWCRRRSLPSDPATPEVIALYVRALANGEVLRGEQGGRKGVRLATIERAVTSISTRNEAAGVFGTRRSPAVRSVILELRQRLEKPRPTIPLTFRRLKDVVGRDSDDFVSRAPPKQRHLIFARKRDRLMFLLAFFGGLSAKELVALDWSDIERRRDHLQIRVKNRGLIMVPKLTADDRFYCPVEAFNSVRWSVASASEAVFVAYDPRCFGTRLSPEAVDRIFQRALRAANVEAGFTARSLRLGLATQKLREGAHISEVVSLVAPRQLAALLQSMARDEARPHA